MDPQASPPFGRLRSLFWPVYRVEYKILIPLLLMFFFINLNYSILRTAKDALILTAQHSGAEVIPFLKTWAILPMSLLLMFVFTRLSNKFNTERVFYVMMGIFLSFFLIFALVIYPFHDSLHSHEFADKMEKLLPLGCHGLITIFRNWTFTLFYVVSELWSPAIVTVLFWGFANEITPVNTAKRFYALIAMGGNVASIMSGEISTWVSKAGLTFKEETGADGWGHSLILFSIVIVLFGLATIAIFRWLNTQVLKKELSKEGSFLYKKEPNEIKMGLRKNFAYLANSKYLLCIAVIVVTYNIAINLTEVVWKDQIRQLYQDPNVINAYMARVNQWIGIVATVFALLSGIILRRFNWTFTAMIPPFILLLTGGAFFTFILFKDLGIEGVAYMVGSSTLGMIVMLGSMQNCLSRASKYTFFDNTKELAFIPLSKECKLKGKAAIDGVGSRFGKSGGAVIYQFLLMFFGTISATMSYVSIALLAVVACWMFAVKSLGKQFKELMDEPDAEPVAQEKSPEPKPEPIV